MLGIYNSVSHSSPLSMQHTYSSNWSVLHEVHHLSTASRHKDWRVNFYIRRNLTQSRQAHRGYFSISIIYSSYMRYSHNGDQFQNKLIGLKTLQVNVTFSNKHDIHHPGFGAYWYRKGLSRSKWFAIRLALATKRQTNLRSDKLGGRPPALRGVCSTYPVTQPYATRPSQL